MDPLNRSLLVLLAEPGRAKELHDLLGDFCHMVRNRLNSLKLGLYLAQRGGLVASPDWSSVEGRYREIEQFVERFQAICRPMALCPMSIALGTVLSERLATWSGWMARRGRTLEWLPPAEEPELWIDPSHLTAALDSWACWRAQDGASGTAVRVSWQATAHDVRWTWSEPETVPWSGESERPPELAVALLARVAHEHGGRLMVDGTAGTAPRLSLVLPRPAPGLVESGPRRLASTRIDPLSITTTTSGATRP
jgi:hypothetical protein